MLSASGISKLLYRTYGRAGRAKWGNEGLKYGTSKSITLR